MWNSLKNFVSNLWNKAANSNVINRVAPTVNRTVIRPAQQVQRRVQPVVRQVAPQAQRMWQAANRPVQQPRFARPQPRPQVPQMRFAKPQIPQIPTPNVQNISNGYNAMRKKVDDSNVIKHAVATLPPFQNPAVQALIRSKKSPVTTDNALKVANFGKESAQGIARGGAQLFNEASKPLMYGGKIMKEAYAGKTGGGRNKEMPKYKDQRGVVQKLFATRGSDMVDLNSPDLGKAGKVLKTVIGDQKNTGGKVGTLWGKNSSTQQGEWADTLKSLGVKENTAYKLGAPLALWGTVDDAFGAGGTDNLAKAIAKTGKIDDVVKLTKGMDLGDDVLEKLVKETDVKKIGGILKGAGDEMVNLFHASPKLPTKGNWKAGTFFADSEDAARYYASSHHAGDINVRKISLPKSAVRKEGGKGIYVLNNELPISKPKKGDVITAQDMIKRELAKANSPKNVVSKNVGKVDVPKNALGVYDHKTGKIGVNNINDNTTVIHEVTHKNYFKLPEEQQGALDYAVNKIVNDEKNYGLFEQLDGNPVEQIARLAEQYLEKKRKFGGKEISDVFNVEGGRELARFIKMNIDDVANNKYKYLSRPTAKISQNIDLSVTPKPTGRKLASPQRPIDSPSSLPKVETSSSLDPDFNVTDYITQQKNAQKLAEGRQSKLRLFADLGREVKTKLEDFTHPIEDVLSNAEKKLKFQVLPSKDIRIQHDKVLRSDSLASQFLKDNGLTDVVQNADNLDELNQYLIAKHARQVSGKGIETGRNLEADESFITTVADKYEPLAQEVYKANRALLDYLADSGMISRKLADGLKKEYPEYVPLSRIFSESEQEALKQGTKTKAIASVSTQNVVKKIKGSKREIENPIESIIEKTAMAFEQGEKNKAAQMLTSYIDIPGNPFQLTKIVGDVKPGTATISVFRDGVKEVFETTPEIATAARNLNKQNIGLLGQIFAVPTRVLRLGATGLNLPFVASNVVKDQVFAAINSSKTAKTSLANPVAFTKALMNAVKHGGLYDDWVRSGASFTSFDIARNQLKPTVRRIRAQRSVPSKIAYTVTHPGDFIRTLEDAIGRSEELTRMQQFEGMKTALLKEGRTLEDANLLAAKASMENTANFARRGEWGTVINSVIPYVNAGIQGARSLRRSIIQRPGATAAKLSTLVFMPVAMTTVWNMSDPKRREAYNDIPEFEKENNIIIIPPDPVYDPKTRRWNVVKVPLTPGITNLGSLVRRQLEGIDGQGNNLKQVAADLFATATSFDVSSKNKIMSQWTPQALKPGIENYTNTNLFTGKNIVPHSMKDLAPEDQVYKNTSGTARKVGKLFGTSPLKVENTIRTTAGGVGSQILNASDRVLNKLGMIPEDQIGGKDTIESIKNRFMSATGGERLNKLEEKAAQAKGSKRKTVWSGAKNAIEKLEQLESNPEKYKIEVQMAKERGKLNGTSHDPLYDQPVDKQKAALQYQAMLIGSAEKRAWYSKNKDWFQPLSEARSKFFDKLPEADPERKAYLQYPDASPEVEAKTEEYNKLPKNQKAAFLKANPQIIEQWDKQFEYTNKVREAKGAAKLKGFPKATPQVQAWTDKYLASSKQMRKQLRNSQPQMYQKMAAYFDATNLYTIGKEASLNQLQGQPDTTSKELKAISNLARDIYKNADGTYRVVPAGWMQGLSNDGGGYGKKGSKGKFKFGKSGRLKKGRIKRARIKKVKKAPTLPTPKIKTMKLAKLSKAPSIKIAKPKKGK